MNFKSFNFHPSIEAGVQALGYITPTPVQRQSIPSILQGRDIMSLAQTGTGKTAAFVLPILQRLMQGPRGRIRALIVAPTRELAEQIHETISGLGKETRLRSVTVYGGVAMNPQIQKLRRGVEIVVACPGRLLDHIRQNKINLSHVEVLVLDEADRMFDMGFLPDIKKIIGFLPAQRQTLFFSATMPDDIRHLAHDILRDPVTVQVDHTIPLTTVSHALYPVDLHQKTALLMEILRHTDTESVLIFTRTKHRARLVAQQLKKAGHCTTSLQGDLPQSKRQAALDGFRNGSFKILVATDIAARGIDVTRISHVINYDMPDTAEAYTHRIGRTGRAAKTGDAFTLITRDDEAMVRAIERTLGVKLERRMLQEFKYNVLQGKASYTRQQPQRHYRQSAPKQGRSRKPAVSRSPARTASTTEAPKRRSARALHPHSSSSAQRTHRPRSVR